jgi:hypothetical protein
LRAVPASARQEDCTKTSSPPRSRSPSSDTNSGAARMRRRRCADRRCACESAACLRCARRGRRLVCLLHCSRCRLRSFAVSASTQRSNAG